MKKIDENLIMLARSGDQVALIELLEKCQPDLNRFSRKVCSSAEDAEDAVQMALWILYKKIELLRTISALSTWLFRIVERECYKIFRLNKNSLLMDANDMEKLFADGNVTNSEQSILRLDLSKAIISLPVTYRTVLILRDVNELTAPEVAEILGISIEAVKSRLHRARNIIRKRLELSGH
ncbi:sigma-70 family RNA polymerase sigma factor [Gilliamella sp. B2776]|uniref:RNA polymerase sigma factor n=1 Tax=unclassified Gilliamella TaxID=2685620 RepID=UPI00226A38C3|nr:MULTISPECIES: sigma-70 family RNA polymerase sigma factor [unclassified Gilliamella]MCX8650768.1 sigma-70 family RNA polymerase sigma factor [Gilliamella sp. B2779]MCX8653868.1 sigma-70 family RNA polymerase sigma factor [Gilliamella sp. B2737]MCX8665697.1 sigma-70 family RNA polymerase sigma factor [Gilliamella sp. B2887]MCX8692616.1 sigma-70 family RNA polymerase sigma factor [Gilliamella sp. B2776]MCX8698545.1 sigma-70 family RNA polymerase sigma factor [Gilliamella sp. B3000]